MVVFGVLMRELIVVKCWREEKSWSANKIHLQSKVSPKQLPMFVPLSEITFVQCKEK